MKLRFPFSSARWTRFLSLLPLAAAGPLAAQTEFERNVYPMPMRCDMAVPADIDSDGDLDIVGVCRTKVMGVQMPEGTVHELFNAEAGGMIHAVPVDMDGDGDLDVAVARFANPHLQGDNAAGPNFTVAWLENSGKIETWKLHIVDDMVHGSHGIDAGDIDGDGKPDLVTANVMGPHFPKSVSWWPGSSGERQFIQKEDAGGRPHYVEVADLNGDGKADIAHGSGNGWKVHLQGETPDDWTHEELGQARGGTNIAVGDFDGDGDLDVAGAVGHGTGVQWFANPGWEATVIDDTLADVHSFSAGDLDGDGDTDIVGNSFKEKITRIYWNDGSGNFTAVNIDEGNDQQSYGSMVVDLDGDGKLDILMGGRQSENAVWYRAK